jgi:hypothetical protein
MAHHISERGEMMGEIRDRILDRYDGTGSGVESGEHQSMDDQAVLAAYRNLQRIPAMLRGNQLPERDVTMFYDAIGMIIQALEEVKKPVPPSVK